MTLAPSATVWPIATLLSPHPWPFLSLSRGRSLWAKVMCSLWLPKNVPFNSSVLNIEFPLISLIHWFILITSHDIGCGAYSGMRLISLDLSMSSQVCSKLQFTDAESKWRETSVSGARPRGLYVTPDTKTKSWRMLSRCSGLLLEILWRFLLNEVLKKRFYLFIFLKKLCKHVQDSLVSQGDCYQVWGP